jgi:hypothetical protein
MILEQSQPRNISTNPQVNQNISSIMIRTKTQNTKRPKPQEAKKSPK